MNVITTLIKSRHSVRKFKPDPIDEKIIRDALECAAHAPTAMNLQPWLFGVVKNKDMLRKIAGLTEYGKFIQECTVCFAVFGEKKRYIILKTVALQRRTLFSHYRLMGSVPAGLPGTRSPMANPFDPY
jgi:nitroreductase